MRQATSTPIRGDFVLIGCGGHARSVADVALAVGHAPLLFADRAARPGETILGFPVVSLQAVDARLADTAYIVALGDNAERAAELDRVHALSGVMPQSVIAPDVRLGADAAIEAGVFVGWGAYIGPCARVGANAIINTRAIVEHEAVVGAHSHVAVNAILLGRSRIGQRVFLGAGAIVRDGVSVASDAVIGAGAVVAEDILEPGIYAGVPARRLSSTTA